MSTEHGLTRRKAFQGAGGAALAIAGAGTAPQALAHDPGRPKPPFDIRDLVPDSAEDSEQVQCYYDTINRSVILAGQIPFKQLFGKPMRWLAPRVDTNVDLAGEYGLLDDPAIVHALLAQLIELAPGLSMGDFFAARRQTVDRPIRDTLLALRNQGVLAPLPTHGRRSERRRRKGLRMVRRYLGEQNMIGYFTTPIDDLTAKERAAIVLGKDVSLMSCGGKNNRCCVNKNKQGHPVKAHCVPMTDKDCGVRARPGPPQCLGWSDICNP